MSESPWIMGSTPPRTEPNYIDPDYAFTSAMDTDRAKLSEWVKWARQQLGYLHDQWTTSIVQTQCAERESAGLRRDITELKEQITQRDDVIKGLRALEQLRKSVTILELGSKVTVVGQPGIAAIIDSALIARGGVSYMVNYWNEGKYLTAMLPAECVTPENDALPLRVGGLAGDK